MNFNPLEIQVLREAAEILKLHKLDGSTINGDYASQHLIDWVNNGSLGIKTFEMSPLEIIVEYYNAHPETEQLQQIREIELYQLGHNLSICYLSKERMNEEQLKTKDMFQHFVIKAQLHISMIPSAGIFTWKLFAKKSETTQGTKGTFDYHIKFHGSYVKREIEGQTKYSAVLENMFNSEIKNMVDIDYLRENVLLLEIEKFISKNNNLLKSLNLI